MRVTRKQQMQGLIRLYREETGAVEVDMHLVAKFAVRKGWRLPKPPDPLDVLSAEFSQVAREEIRRDAQTGLPYRANHAFAVKQGATQLFLWIDIDEAPRPIMVKSLISRREQIVGDVVQLSLDAEHWNRIHPEDEPIAIPADFTDDVEWRRNGSDEMGA